MRPMLRKGKANMDIIIAGISVVASIAAIIIAKMLDMNGFITAAIVILAILFAIFSLARVGIKKSKTEETTEK
jgi:hypothetical protein